MTRSDELLIAKLRDTSNRSGYSQTMLEAADRIEALTRSNDTTEALLREALKRSIAIRLISDPERGAEVRVKFMGCVEADPLFCLINAAALNPPGVE